MGRPHGLDWLPDDGEMARRIRDHDWSDTALGPIASWPPALRSTLLMILDNPLPMALAWGSGFATLHNDAYLPLLGDKADALGASFLDVWDEARDTIAPQVASASAGRSTRLENAAFRLLRSDRFEDAWFDYAFSPIRDDAGAVVGILNTAVETTGRVLAERRRAADNEALAESEELRRIAVEGGRMGTWRANLRERTISGDATFMSLWGFPPTDQPRPCAEFLDRMSPEGRELMAALISGTAKAGDVFDGEHPLRSGPAAGRCVRWRGRAERERPWIFNGVCFDITDQRRSEEQLRKSEARHRLLIESWAQAVWEADAAGIIVSDSPSWRAYTGQTLDEWLGYGWLDAIHPDDRTYAERKWREAIATHGLVDAEFRLRSRDGGWRWTNVRAAPVLDADGRVEKWAGMNIDIHEKKLARQALDASELFSRALVEGVPQLVWRAVDGGDWTWASPQWTAFTGKPEPESHGRGWLEPIHADDREEAMRFWHRAGETGRLEMEGRIRHAASGRYRWFQTRATPVRAADGRIVEWLGTSTDVDDLRRLQDRQQVLVAELQHRVRNILTVVRSVFTRTAEADTSLERVVEHFRGRLDNLARIQVVVTRSASGAVDLRSLIFDELLSVGVAGSPAVTLDGPEVALDQTTAESIGLAIHELTTNAVKYGALRVIGATLAITWSTNSVYGEARVLNLIWTEQGVPAVQLKPSRQGFGSELIREALPYRLGAETELEFRGGGVRCSISVPLPDGTAADAWEHG